MFKYPNYYKCAVVLIKLILSQPNIFCMKFYKHKSIFKIITCSLLFSMALVSCKKDSNVVVTSDAAVKIDTLNLAYGTDAQQKMDMYLPANRTDSNTNVFVMIHGGTWKAGDKSDLNPFVAQIKSGLSTYAIININYRLAIPPVTNLWPTQLTDVKAAFDFIVSQAGYYHYNANKIAVYGESAGAHLAMLKAYQANTGGSIKAVIDVFGPTDMGGLYAIQTGTNQQFWDYFMGGDPTANPAAYTAASPLLSVTPTSPPTIIFHGDADTVVPYNQSEKLNNALQNAGVAHQYTLYAGDGHGQFTQANTLDAFTKALAFTIANVK
jgi:acetyl esterase/lipase